MWFLFALGTAFFQGVKDVFIKKSGDASGLVLCWGYTWCTAALLWIAAFSRGVPDIGPGFWTALICSALINAVAMSLYFTALRLGELSLTAPMLVFTPLFMLITTPLILGEFPRPLGLIGIVCIVAGSYILNMGRGGNGPFAPFRALAASRGPRIMLAVAALWSVGANFDKIGVPASGPEFWIASLFTSIALVLTAVVGVREKGLTGPLRSLRSMLPILLAVSAAEAVGLVLQMYAITLTLVPYVIAVKRLSAVFGVAFGAMFLGERGLGFRLAGASIMVAGVACITLWG